MKGFKGSTCGRQSARVSAVDFIYKLCGTSQPSIILASDGAWYVVKFNGFPGSQALINEAVGSQLLRLMGLPSPDWTPIEASSDFIDRNREAWFHAKSPIRPHPGLHFGSRIIEAPGEQRTYQLIPHSWIGKIKNRGDYLGALILDLWANSCDRRQAVFLSDEDQNQLHATFIDNDWMFGGKFGDETTGPRRAMVCDLDYYEGLWSEKSVKEWLQKIDGIDENAIGKVLLNVPKEWAGWDVRTRIFDQLRKRRSMLPSLVSEAREYFNSGDSFQYHGTRNATKPAIRDSSVFPAW